MICQKKRIYNVPLDIINLLNLLSHPPLSIVCCVVSSSIVVVAANKGDATSKRIGCFRLSDVEANLIDYQHNTLSLYLSILSQNG